MSDTAESSPCKCIEILQKKLSEHHGAEVALDLKQSIDMKTYEVSPALPPLYYSYRDGKKTKRSFLTFAFCPFCGRKNQ